MVSRLVDVETFYLRYGPMVMRRCRKLLRSDAQAQDAMQDVFVQLLRQPELEAASPAALLLRIATNVCLNKLRSGRRRPEDADDELVLRIADSGAADAEQQTVARGVLARLFGGEGALAASSQTIAVMHLVDGMTLEEVASEVGMSVSGVRKRLRTLRARLAALETAPSSGGA